jgi:V/A-type H+-transporting ATPase subunit I
MYGLPAHDEMDPTVFVGLTYALIFGALFGDAGQGAVLFIGGGLLYLLKKMKLAGIISVAGIFSVFFGIMFGSVFGFEDVIHAVWLKPVEAMTKLPFIGQLNTVFIVAVAFGMGLNLLVMIFQMVNAAKSKNLGELLFSHNGLAGFVFYAFIVVTIVLFMTGHKTPGNVLLIVFLGVPILLFFFKEPLTNLVTHNKKKLEEGKGMFITQGFFELFETLLSYFSNTLSYVRIGAFAVSHAAIMEVVLMLSGAEAGHTNIVGVIFGNIVVCVLEGLVVGIQVLRLEYYEIFSRFYKGSGREFKPFNDIEDKNKKKSKK